LVATLLMPMLATWRGAAAVYLEAHPPACKQSFGRQLIDHFENLGLL
jgi:hypothetical protein